MSDLRSELLAIREKRGSLTARIVADEARVKTHPLHDKIYDVPQKEAAERYYINNAARLLRVTFRAVVSDRPADLRAFLVVPDKLDTSKSSYVPIEEVMADPVDKALVLRRMLREFHTFKSRYMIYAEFAEMVKNDPDIFPVDPDEEFGPEPGTGTDG